MSHNSELAARMECLAEKRESIAAQRTKDAKQSDFAGFDKLAELERSMAKEHADFAADLRAAAQAVRAMEWRPITDAPDNKPLLIGKWVERDWMEPVGTFSKLAAQRLGYTHYLIVPAPPEVGG